MRIFTIMLLFLSALSCMGQTDRQAMQQAIKAYNDSDYVKCVGLYQKLLQEEGSDSELYYNLGNAYTRLENYGSAVLNYRKALKIDALNFDASHNLAYVDQIVSMTNEKMVEDRNLDPTPDSPSFFFKIRGFMEAPGSNFWAWISGITFILVCVSAALYFFSPATRMKKLGFFVAAVSLLGSFGSYALSVSSRKSALSQNECVLMAPQYTLKEQPSAKSKDVAAPLCGGTTFRIIGQGDDADKGHWIKVRLNDDFTGWIPADNVEIVKI